MSEIIGVPDEPSATPLSNAQLEIQDRERANATPSPEAPVRGMKAIVAHVKRELDSFKGDQPQSDNGSVSEEPSTRPVDDGGEKPEPFTSKKAQDWRRLKAELANQRLSASEYKSKYEALVRGGNNGDELSKLKAEKDELSAQLARLELQNHPEFRSRFESRLNEALTVARKELGGNWPDDEFASVVQHEPGQKRDGALSSYRKLVPSDIARARFDAAIVAYDRIRNERESALTNSREGLKKAAELQAYEEQRAQQLSAARRAQEVERVLGLARSQFPAFKYTGDPAHDDAVTKNIENVKKFYAGQMSDDDVAALPLINAEASRILREVVPSLAKENQELKSALRELRYSTPAPAAGSRRGDSEEKPRKSFVESVSEQWREGGMLK